MTSCSECLTELRTVRLAEIRADSSVALHYATCHNCRRVAEDLFYAETRLANALAEVQPYSLPETIATQAFRGANLARRRRIAVWLRRALLLVGAALIPLALEAVLEDDPPPVRRSTETLTLTCITPARAHELASAYLTSDATINLSESDGSHAITLRGKADDVAAAKQHIEAMDGADRCAAAPVIVGKPAKTPAGK